MKLKERIFGNKNYIALGGVLMALTIGAGANAATTNYGCDDEKNDRITPELALCSVHAYNIGQTKNPESESDKQLMRDVVALKTTVITQQMYKQYEYLDSMIARFKTQLKKAVLTTSLQASGATGDTSNSGNTGGGYVSNDRTFYIAGVQNCNNEISPLKVFECLNTNLNSIYNASNNGTNISVELRKQLANDFNLAIRTLDNKINTSGNNDNAPTYDTSASFDGTTVADCTKYKNIGQRKQFQACMEQLRIHIRRGYSDNSEKNNQKKNQ